MRHSGSFAEDISKMTKERKLDHIVILRVLAIILVVLGHAARDIHKPNFHMYSPLYTPSWEITLKTYIYSFHMPLFFWISGYIFYFVSMEKNKGNTSIVHEIKKKIKRLVIPLYATSFLILMPTIILFGHPHGSIVHMVKTFLLCQNNDHLWFLKALFIIFLFLIPIHKYINRSSLLNIFVLSILFVISHKNDNFPRTIWYSLRYIPFFYAGYLSRRFNNIFKKGNTFLLFFVSFLSHLILFMTGRFISNIYVLGNLLWYIIAILGIYYMYYLSIEILKLNLSDRLWGCIYYIDKRSYFIYLFHVTVLYIILYLYSFTPKGNALYRLIPSFVFGIILSLIFYDFLSFNRIFCFLFSIPYSKHLVTQSGESHSGAESLSELLGDWGADLKNK